MEASLKVGRTQPTLKESLFNAANIGVREDLNAL